MNVYQLTFHRFREVMDEVVVTVQAMNVDSAIEEGEDRVYMGLCVTTKQGMPSPHVHGVADVELCYVDNLGQVGSEELKESMV